MRNVSRLRLFLVVTLSINIISIAAAALRGSLFSAAFFSGTLFWASQEYVALLLLRSRAAPETLPDGEIVECADISSPEELGLYSYAQDLLWVCWAAHGLSSLSSWFVIIYAPVPAMALYKSKSIWTLLLGGLFGDSSATSSPSNSDPTDSDPRSRLHRRRAELRQSKVGREKK